MENEILKRPNQQKIARTIAPIIDKFEIGDLSEKECKENIKKIIDVKYLRTNNGQDYKRTFQKYLGKHRMEIFQKMY